MAKLQCPRDGSGLEVTIYESNVEVDQCPTCRGMWLDKGELEQIEASDWNDYSRELKNEPEIDPPSIAELQARKSAKLIECPKCGVTMERREYGYSSGIFIDTCVEGCGVWLDRGEVQELEKFFERNRSNETIPLGWRLWASVLSVFKGSKSGGTKKPAADDDEETT